MLNLTALREKSVLIIIVISVFFIGLILLGFFTKTTPKPAQTSQASPFPSPSGPPPQVIIPPKQETLQKTQNIKQIRDKIIASKIENDNGDIVLFKSDSYRIIYVPTPDLFFVNIFKDPQNSKTSAEKWFLDFGLKAPDLCTLPVRFLINFELKQQSPDFNILPNRCS